MHENITEKKNSTHFEIGIHSSSLHQFSKPPSTMVRALAVRSSPFVACASSSASKQQQQQLEQAARAPASIAKPQTALSQRLRAATVSLAAASLAVISTSAFAQEEVAAASPSSIDAPALFSRTCAGCHAGGGNVVSPGNTLFELDLSRNGLLSSDKLFEVIYSGRGKMPGYGANCAPKGACTFAARLRDEEVKALGDFVLERAGQGWK